ncbi:hypothetical protein VKT23_013915 [Stygiomarasmius scandens]|uniref:Uncharacterized protein n=1 Tax=Marasmiellus scandens TaxID=2682957 RepID=A0ABR1J1U7_9AGAR
MEVLGALAEDENDKGEKEMLEGVQEEDERSKRKKVRPGGRVLAICDRLTVSLTYQIKRRTMSIIDVDASDTAPIHEDDEETNGDDEADENVPFESSIYPPIPRGQVPAAPSTPRRHFPSSTSTGRMFMTPQPPSQVGTRISLAPRVSLGGDGPHRIKIEKPVWKVRDRTFQLVSDQRHYHWYWPADPVYVGEETLCVEEFRYVFGGIPGIGTTFPMKLPLQSNGLVPESGGVTASFEGILGLKDSWGILEIGMGRVFWGLGWAGYFGDWDGQGILGIGMGRVFWGLGWAGYFGDCG